MNIETTTKILDMINNNKEPGWKAREIYLEIPLPDYIEKIPTKYNKKGWPLLNKNELCECHMKKYGMETNAQFKIKNIQFLGILSHILLCKSCFTQWLHDHPQIIKNLIQKDIQ